MYALNIMIDFKIGLYSIHPAGAVHHVQAVRLVQRAAYPGAHHHRRRYRNGLRSEYQYDRPWYVKIDFAMSSFLLSKRFRFLNRLFTICA